MAKKQLNEMEMETITLTTGEELAKQPKRKIRLPLAQKKRQELETLENAGKPVEWPFHPVQINGYIYQIQLGKTVEVPETVADVLEQAGLI
ncbi:hypothetical protein [Cytobacillus oceanisediminis]|uniref:hypothetical protein n=1 Tax=Cytobacillus oceanisediminis TaxID=665099 RepID=UPI0037364D8E